MQNRSYYLQPHTNLWSLKLRTHNFDKTKNTVPVCKFDCPRAPRPKLFFHVRHQQADALGARICSTMRQRCQPAKFWGMFSWLTQTWQFLSWHFGWWPNTWPLVHHRLQTSMQHKTMQFFHARPQQVLQESQKQPKRFLHDTRIMKTNGPKRSFTHMWPNMFQLGPFIHLHT